MNKIILLAPILSLMIACSGSADSKTNPALGTNARVGNEGANGGNFEAQEAARLSGELLLLVRQSQPMYSEVDVQALEAVIAKTRIFMVPEVVVNGQETDASNNGVDEIQISSPRWKLKTDRLAKVALLLHEYLGILGLEINNYKISNRIINPAYSLASGVRYSCDDRYSTAISVRYNVTSDVYYFKFDGIDVKAFQAKNGYAPDARTIEYAGTNWAWETCGNSELVGKKINGKFNRIGACRSNFRSYDQLEFLDGQGLFFSESQDPYTLTCFPIRE